VQHQAGLAGSVVVAAVVALGRTVCGGGPDLPDVAVVAYNYASIRAEILRPARAQVNDIFLDAGVRLVWIEPLIVSDWQEPSFDSLPMFRARMFIRPGLRTAPANPRESEMGRALESSETTGTSMIFFEQVRVAADKYHLPVETVLALAMAHELGHLLLPHPAHATTGIMLGMWTPQDVRHAAAGKLRFTPEQAALIRAKVCRSQ
jgi:hypothetical protein